MKEIEAIKCLMNNVTCHLDEPRAMAINALKEIQQYRALGTVEELNIAKEKQIPKKPKTDDRYVMYVCPCCNDFIKISHNYCTNCGQKLDWSE